MSLAIKYENVEDASMRLRNTVVLYKGDPVLITDVRPAEKADDGILRVLIERLPIEEPAMGKAMLKRGEVRWEQLRNPPGPAGLAGPRVAPAPLPDDLPKEQARKYISSKHFDIAPFKMGYVNDPDCPFFCTRLPNRIQKQGLCADNFKAVSNFGAPVQYGYFLRSSGVPDMVHGRYPTTVEALRMLEKQLAVAVSRDFCLQRDDVLPEFIYLFYQGKKIGMYTDNRVRLGQKFNCLKESLEELKLYAA